MLALLLTIFMVRIPTTGPILSYLAGLEPEQRRELIESLEPDDLAELERETYNWRLFARPEQTPPTGEWGLWVMQAGRAGGKTWAGANFSCEFVEQNPGCRFGLFGPTAAKVRDVMVEDQDSGILAVCPPHLKANYEPTKRRISFENGARCITYSADNPDQSRGANLHGFWADEVGEWKSANAWHNLQMALRKAKRGFRTRGCVTTTPRPTDLIREIMQGPKDAVGRRPSVRFEVLRSACGELPASYIARPRPGVVITKWPTDANKANVAEDFLQRMKERYAGTRLGRQELEAEILDDTPGALWALEEIDKGRISLATMPRLTRIVVSVDPSHAGDGSGDACGIIVCGATGDRVRHGYVRADRTVNAGPYDWGKTAIAAYNEFRADLIVYESNDSPGKPNVVADVIRNVDPHQQIKWFPIHSSRDKRTRADPVASFYETARPGGARIHHVRDPSDPDQLALLEDEMTSWDPASPKSPNRLDALVHGMSYLMLEGPGQPAAPVGVGQRKNPWKVG